MEHLKNACRLCLVNNSNIRSIFKDDNVNWVEKDLVELIFECTKIKVSQFDGLTGICRLCLQEIISIIKFRKKCLMVDKYIKTTFCGIYFNQENINEIENLETKLTDDHLIGFIDLGCEEEIFKEEENKKLIYSDTEVSNDNLPDIVLNETFPTIYETEDVEEEKNENEILENTQQKDAVLVKCTYKLRGGPKPQQNNDIQYPKLKKRDLMVPKAYKGLCHYCGREFQHLWVHLQSHSEIPTEYCDICGKGFKSKANLQLHVLTHKDAEIPCEICGKKYRTRMRLKRHNRVHTGVRPYECEICQKRFYTKYNLEVHNRTHTGEKPFVCTVEFCHECFTHSYALKHHLEKVHRIDGK